VKNLQTALQGVALLVPHVMLTSVRKVK